jgi:hypothetical protein
MNRKNHKKVFYSGDSLLKNVSESGTTDLAVDISEIELDKLLENMQNEAVGQIPIVKTVYAIAKAGYAVHDFFFKKKLIKFIAGFKDADVYLKQKIEKVLPNPNDKQEMGEHLIVALQRFDQITKADALCKLFLARINGIITHREFQQLTLALDRMDFTDVDVLKQFYSGSISGKEQQDILRSFAFTKLVSVDYSGRPEHGQLYPRSGGGDEKFLKNSLGQKFVKALELL